MNQRIENCLYQAGLTAQGCWDELDDYAKEAIEKFAELIVRECAVVILEEMKITPQVHSYWGPFWDGLDTAQKMINNRFGVK